MTGYALIFNALFFITYKGKPLLYISNNYYTWKGGTTYSKTREFDKKKKYDIVFIGSSRSYRGYNPFYFEEMGYSAFNLGTSAQTIKNTYFLAVENIHNNNTGLLLVDLFSGAFSGSDLESSSDIIQNASDDKLAFDVAFWSADIRCWNVLFSRLMAGNTLPYYKDTDYLGRGFSAKTDSIGKAKADLIMQSSSHSGLKSGINTHQLYYFKKLIEFLRKNNIRTVFVYSPVINSKNNTNQDLFLKEVLPVIKEHNFQFLDYTSLNGIIPSRHFYDESHLNYEGVMLFNKKLLDDLAENKILTDER